MADSAERTLSHHDGRSRRAGAPSPRPFLYRVLSCEQPLLPPARHALAGVDLVGLGRGDAPVQRSAGDEGEREGERRLILRVPDRWMSSEHARLVQVLGRWVLEDEGSRNGTRVNDAPARRVALADGDVIECGHTFFLYRDAVPALANDPPDFDAGRAPPDRLHTTPGLSTMVPALARELAVLAEVARSPVSVVVTGESGTGKELIARAVHRLSGRPGAFVAVNCGAIPETLIESELFGSRKGAFSGATEERPGLVRASDHGTLFLDEIGDLPPPSQAAFLRVLQEREVVPVGGTRPVPVDLRVVAATHRDLPSLVDAGKFRQDLLARIAGFQLSLPALRERREDIGLLAATLLSRAARAIAVPPDRIHLGLDAGRALLRHRFPLNVRELEKCLATALVLARAEAREGECTIELHHLPEAMHHAMPDAMPDGMHRAMRAPAAGPPAAAAHPAEGAEAPLGEADARRRDQIVALLREHDGNVSAVARALGKARMQVQRWLRRYGLDPEDFKR